MAGGTRGQQTRAHSSTQAAGVTFCPRTSQINDQRRGSPLAARGPTLPLGRPSPAGKAPRSPPHSAAARPPPQGRGLTTERRAGSGPARSLAPRHRTQRRGRAALPHRTAPQPWQPGRAQSPAPGTTAYRGPALPYLPACGSPGEAAPRGLPGRSTAAAEGQGRPGWDRLSAGRLRSAAFAGGQAP